MAPMNKIFAYGVSPVYLGVVGGGFWIVLVEQVIFPFPVDQTVWIVDPSGDRKKVIVRFERRIGFERSQCFCPLS